jgi:sarcosine oxidase, subunit beta
MSDTADVVVIGGGCEGSSIAWQLARRRVGPVVLIEKLGIAAGATGRSSAIVRQHYTHETLARMARHAVEIFSRFDEIVGGDAEFRQVGFLALYGPADAETLAANVAMQRRVGINVELLRSDELHEIEPWMVCDDVAGAAWEPDGGYADPVATTNSFIAAARRLGVDCRIGAEVERLLVEGERVVGVMTRAGEIRAGTVVVAAGCRSRELLAPHGFEFPVTPVRHAIAIVERSDSFGRPHPVVADRLTGSYYRPEGATLTLIGWLLSGMSRTVVMPPAAAAAVPVA